MTDFNIPLIYANAFGIRGKQFRIPGAEPAARGADFRVDMPEETTGAGFSYLGIPYFMRTKLNGLQLPNEPMIDITGGKRIALTEMDGANGTFKELYSLDDYKITIRGLLITEDGSNDFPETQLRDLNELYLTAGELSITNQLCAMLNIAYIAIQSIDYPSAEGLQGAQPYVITALSDNRVNLIIEK